MALQGLRSLNSSSSELKTSHWAPALFSSPPNSATHVFNTQTWGKEIRSKLSAKCGGMHTFNPAGRKRQVDFYDIKASLVCQVSFPDTWNYITDLVTKKLITPNNSAISKITTLLVKFMSCFLYQGPWTNLL